jgi:hypothetical protein
MLVLLLNVTEAIKDAVHVISLVGVGHFPLQGFDFVVQIADASTASRSQFVNHWDLLEKRPRPPAPYLIQGIRHPSTAGIQTIRSRIREISIVAGA